MVSAEIALPFTLKDEDIDLETEVTETGDRPDEGRRIEDWIVSTLDDQRTGAEAENWHDLLGRISLTRRHAPKVDKKTPTAKKSLPKGWTRFRLERGRGITIVVLTDTSLIKEDDLTELYGDLMALVEAGHHRLILNFAGVERLSSWAAGAVAEAVRQCVAARGGALRVCGLRSPLDAIFSVTGLAREVAIYPDEATAKDTPWPETPELRSLPYEILASLTRFEDPSPPYEAHPASDSEPNRVASTPAEGLPVMSILKLVSHQGASKGKSVSIEGPRFVIGRDSTCNLRPGSPAVSRFHAAIERRGSRLFLRDLGSTNGTLFNGRILRDAEAEIRDKDKIQVGSLAFTVEVGGAPAPRAKVDDMVVSWLWNQDQGATLDGEEQETEDFSILDDFDGVLIPKHEVIEGVVVVTPRSPELDLDRSIDPLRAKLQTLFEQGMPRRVVLNLAYVGHVSGRAIGVLVAHHLKLDRAGGCLRICEANARVSAVFDQVRLGMLVDCHPTIDDAVLTPWSRRNQSAPT